MDNKEIKISPEYKSVYRCRECNKVVFYYKESVEFVSKNNPILLAEDCLSIYGSHPCDGDTVSCPSCGAAIGIDPSFIFDR